MEAFFNNYTYYTILCQVKWFCLINRRKWLSGVTGWKSKYSRLLNCCPGYFDQLLKTFKQPTCRVALHACITSFRCLFNNIFGPFPVLPFLCLYGSASKRAALWTGWRWSVWATTCSALTDTTSSGRGIMRSPACLKSCPETSPSPSSWSSRWRPSVSKKQDAGKVYVRPHVTQLTRMVRGQQIHLQDAVSRRIQAVLCCSVSQRGGPGRMTSFCASPGSFAW